MTLAATPGMTSRAALAALALATMIPTAWGAWASRPAPLRACAAEGRGDGVRTWVGCAADPGPRRELLGRERVVFGMPVPLNEATAEDLAEVPGLTARIAREVVAERVRGGPFQSVESLLRVHGVGPRRLALARAHLVAE
ncbi:MAG TPA: helix-hairpin-helix domain-containing protein [Anaeromyxobacteraceae bacterium]|nr:helix-hairpin-helix domain-containing protein [Anaeromyxobacteraceae bacterium]